MLISLLLSCLSWTLGCLRLCRRAPLTVPRASSVQVERPPEPTPVSLMSSAPVALPLGRRQEECLPFVITENHLSHHMLILGTTGSGKSCFAELICRNLIDSLRGFCYIDPHADTAENLFAYAMKKCEEEGTDAICHQIHFVELSFETVFGYDPFRAPDFGHLAAAQRETAYRSWLDAKVDQFSEIVQLNQGNADFQGMPLLQRGLRDCLYAVGIAVDEAGNHLSLADIFVVLDCDHRRHREVFEVVRPFLPAEIRADITRWQMLSREQRVKETQSTLNRLRSLLSPLLQAVFADTARTLDFRRIVRERGILLVSIRKSEFLSAAQRNAVATMFIHEIWAAVQTEEREHRSDTIPYYLFIDEAPKFIGKDFAEILSEGRKFKLSLILIGQHLSQFKKGDVDLIPDILSLCRTFACFQQMNPDDLEVLKKYFGYPNLDLTELFSVQDRPDGYEFLKLEELSRSFARGSNWNEALSLMENDTVSESDTVSKAHQESRATAHAHAEGAHHTANAGGGQTVNRDAAGNETGRSQSGQRSAGNGTTSQDNVSQTAASSDTETHAHATASSKAKGIGLKIGEGGSEQEGYSIAHRTQILQKFIEKWYPTGRLRFAVEDQLHRMAQIIRTLAQRHAVVSLFGEQRTFEMAVADVPNVVGSGHEMAALLRAFKQKIYSIHDYYLVPNLSPEAQERRLADFLARVADSRLTVEEAARRLLEDALGDDAESVHVEAGADNPLA